MNSDYSSSDKAAGTETEHSNLGKPCCCEDVKNSIVDRLRRAAAALDKTATEQGENSGVAEFEQHAAQWLNQSAEYIRQFDYEREEANVRKHIAQNPGRSLMIAGAVGLVLGILLRKR